MIIDCDRCQVRGDACRDCVVGVFLELPGRSAEGGGPGGLPSGAGSVQLDAPEFRALGVLADQGLIPRLRLVADEPRHASPTFGINEGLSNAG
jgi:hypothetical protein